MIVRNYNTTSALGFLKSRIDTLGIMGDGAGKSALSLFDQVAVSATGFLSGVIVARNCTLAELGAYHLALSILLIFRGMQAEIITAPFTVYNHLRKGDRLATYTGSVIIHQMVFLGAALLVLAAIGLAASKGFTPTAFKATFPILLVAGPLALMREFLQLYAFARFWFKSALVTDFTVLLLQVGGLLGLMALIGLTVNSVFVVIAIASGLACLAWWWVSRPRVRIQKTQVLADWRENWAFGRWTLLSFVVSSCTPYLMTWLVAWLRSEAEAGKLAACVGLIGLANMFLSGIANVLTPKMATVYTNEGVAGLKRVCTKVILLFSGVLGLFSWSVFILGDWLGSFVYGAAFADVGFLCGIISLGILVTSFALVAGRTLCALNRPRANLLPDLVTAVVTLGGALYLVPGNGILGAAYALLLGSGLGMLVRWSVVFRNWHHEDMK
jgi:O-antigen/teichoic acid export membrane protein